MKTEIVVTNKAGRFNAHAIYENGAVVVKKGGIVNPNFASSIRGGKLSKKYRSDRQYVSEHFEILQDCAFKSPSTAAQFVTGRSVDGYNAWKVETGQTLGDFLKEKGLR